MNFVNLLSKTLAEIRQPLSEPPNIEEILSLGIVTQLNLNNSQ